MDQRVQTDTAQERIFIIDDDASLRASLARLMRSAGWETETFASAREFLDRPLWNGCGCLLLDLNMPEMTGMQLQDELRARGMSLPIVFLTGHPDVSSSVRAMKNGAVDYLLKPLEPEALLRTVQEALDGQQALRGNRQERQEIDSRLARLSRREREVMDQVVVGRLNKQIADRLDISLKTVKAHRARVMEKMEVRSVAVLVHLCERAGIDLQPVD